MSLPTSAHRAALLLGLVAALAGAATPASAATVSQEGDALVYRAAPGELNRVYLNGSYNPAGRFRIEDSTADITDLPATCTRRAIDMVDCDVPGRVRVELGDGNDVVGFSEDYAFSIPVEVFGGDGDDRLDGDHRADRAEVLRGEGGRDVLTGFGGNDQLFGGPGNDDLDGRGGNDEVRGEDGDDKVSGDGQAAPGADVVDGGAGNDQVQEYVEYGVDVHPPADISLDGQANDGRAGEGDNVTSIERMTAYVSGRHVLSDGPEDWQVWSNMNSGASDVLAGGGDDKITGSDAIERIDGGAGNDRLEGGKNHDVLTGGPGEDLLYADETSSSCNESFPESCVRYGNDVVYAVDGQVDGIDCGAGTDRVEADPDDVVAANCETVVRKGAAGPGAGPDPKPGPGTGPGAEPQNGAQLAVAGGKLRAALTKGLSVRLSGMSPGRTRVVASVGARTVGGATVQVGADGAATARIRFTKAARRTLARKRSVTLRVRAGAARTTVKLGR